MDKDEDDRQTERTLDVLAPDGDPWALTTVTSRDEGSGVAVPVTVVIYGDKDQSPPLQFGDDLDFKFKDGESQEFLLHVRDSVLSPALAWQYVPVYMTRRGFLPSI